VNIKTQTRTFASVLLATFGLGLSADYSTWTGHRDIVLNTSSNGAGITTEVHNFPVLVRLGAAEATILAAAGTNGASIRFSKADNTTPLRYEIEQWSTTSAAIWVKVDTIKPNNATQKIIMHWGNGTAVSESSGPAVFDTAVGFVGAWHLGNAAGTSPRPGSVAGSPKAIVRNGLPAVPGIIGMADTLSAVPGVDPGNGSNPLAGRYLDMGRDSAGNDNNYAGFSDFTGGFAYSIWLNATTTAGFTRLLVMGADSNATNEQGSPSRILFMGNQNQSTTQPNFSIRWAGLTNYNSPANAYAFGTWTQIFVSKPAGTSAITVYKNGEVLSSSVEGDAALNVMRNYVWVGRSSAGTDGFYGGKVDNLTLAKRARSADWIKLSFQNQKAVNALVDIGSYAYTGSAPGIPSNVTGTAGDSSVTVSWTAPPSNGSPITSSKAMVSDDSTKSCTAAGTATTCTITGLVNGTPYTFIVSATNAVGTGSSSFVSEEVTPIGRPLAPLSPQASIAGTGMITVSWVANSDGGSPVTQFKASANDTSKSCTTTGLSCTISGLAVGTSYTFTIKATNAIGTSPASVPTAPLIATGILPGSLVINVGNFTNAYTFQLPEAMASLTGNLTMTISDVTGKTVWSKSIQPSKGNLEISWNGLTSKGSAVSAGMYIVRIQSVNAAGALDIVQSGVKLRQD
jgi:hypothetical protein